MKLSATDWSFQRGIEDIPAYYAKIKSMGYDAIEMATPDNWPLLRAAGLELLNLTGPGMQEGLNRLENHEQLIPELLESLQTTAEAEIPYLIVFSGNRTDAGLEEGRKHVLKGIEKILPDAERLGVTLLFEMLNGFDHVGYEATASDYGFKILEELRSDHLKIVYDIYHMHRSGENIIADIETHFDKIAHYHIAGSPKRNFPSSDGEIAYVDIIEKIQDLGYEGFFGMEFIPDGDPLKELESAAELFTSYSLSRV